MKWDFFLAHASADKAVAEDLYDLLIDSSRVFIDTRCLKLGDDWDLALARAQKASRVSVILVSSNATESYYHREEITAAIALARSDNDQHRVVPLYLPYTNRNALKIPYGLGLKHGIEIESKEELPRSAKELLGLLKQLDTIHDPEEKADDISKQEKLEWLLTQFSNNCTKAEALEIEDRIYDLVRDDEDLLLGNSRQYVAPAREAIAVVAGRLLHGDSNDIRLVELLKQLAGDPDKWVRKKAEDGLFLSGY